MPYLRFPEDFALSRFPDAFSSRLFRGSYPSPNRSFPLATFSETHLRADTVADPLDPLPSYQLFFASLKKALPKPFSVYMDGRSLDPALFPFFKGCGDSLSLDSKLPWPIIFSGPVGVRLPFL